MKKKFEKKRCALLRCAISVVLMMLALIASLVINISCAEEKFNPASTDTEVNIDDYKSSERTLSTTVSITDTLAKSDAIFQQTSIIYNPFKETVSEYHPSAEITIRLSKERINLKSVDEIPAKLIKEQITKQVPYKQGTTFGEDVEKVFEYDNGQVATVNWKYRYQGIIQGTDTLPAPYQQILSVAYTKETNEKYGTQTQTEDPYRTVLHFNATSKSRGVSGEEKTIITELKPWYYKVVKSEVPDAVKTDSIYTLKGENDEYIVEKTIIWSDESQTSSTYSYTGKHSAEAIAFGEVITTSLNWKENELKKASSTTKTDEKKFSSSTWFSAVYTTSNWQSTATNGTENGIFAFKETSPIVTFTDGNTTKTFPERKYTIEGIGADVSTSASTVVRDNVTYKAYAYNYTTNASWNGNTATPLVSTGLLLMLADEKGETTYTTKQTWNGKTTTLKVIKTTPHSNADDEVKTFSKDFTISLGELTDDKLYADNLSFNTSETHNGTNTSATDGFWLIKTHSTTYNYLTTNNAVKREQSIVVKDAEITFNDGTFKHTFDIRLAMDMSEKIETEKTRTEGNYDITPHKLTATGTTVDGKSFSTTGNTDIYVKKQVSVNKHSKKTVVYDDGTVDFILIKDMSDGSTQTIKASDTYGNRFAFNFKNTNAQTKVVQNAEHIASSSTGTATTDAKNQGLWQVTEYIYPYTHTLSNSISTDKLDSPYSYSSYTASYNDTDLGTINFDKPSVSMSNSSSIITANGSNAGYSLYNAEIVVNGKASGTEGSYSTNLTITHTLKVANNDKNLGKPKGFYATATYDPSSKVTRRAFLFQWEDGVTYAVCDYETMLPKTSDFSYQKDSYQNYNSVGYNKNNSKIWEPARGIDKNESIEWYNSNNTMISIIDKALSCKVIGWKNIVNGKYALVIPGYTYTTDGYNITVKAPNGETVTFTSHYK